MFQTKLLPSLFFIFFLVSIGNINAQLNIKIGYSIGYVQADSTNKLIQDFNNGHQYDKPLEEFKILHGVLVGLRYRINDVAIHLDWNNKFNLLKGSGTDASGISGFQKVFFKNASYGLGLEFFGTEKFSFGGTIDFDVLTYRLQNDGLPDKATILNDYGLGSHFYVSINIEGSDILTLNLQPYVQIPWTSYDIHALDNAINDKDSNQRLAEKYLNFGVRIIFSNGSF